VIAMTVTVITIPELAAALTAERLVERAVIDHVEALLALVRPLPAAAAIRLLTDLTAVIEKRGRP
jgi:hypothetical protein